MITNIHFQTLPAIDLARARDFYTAHLGCVVARDEAYGESRWIFVALPGAQTMLHFDRVESVAPTRTPALVLLSDDVDADCARLTAEGVTIVNGPDDAPWDRGTRWAMLHDSEGNLVLLQTIGSDG